MGLWDDIGKGDMTVGRLWQKLDQETRLVAATSLYRHDFEDDGATHMLADAQVAGALNFRPVAVRKLPVERRARSIALARRLDADLITSMLAALHFETRREMMASFLDALGVKHDDGAISPDQGDLPSDPDLLGAAIQAIFDKHPVNEVELYLATLYLGDPGHWKIIGSAMERRRSAAGSKQ